jgi:excinuclease ABC subunit A
MTLRESLRYFEGLHLQGNKADIAAKVVARSAAPALSQRRGLTYLSLSRSADTLSGGESQRIRLASQIGSGLTGVMYVLDEPSIGLHQRDNDRLIATLKHLRDLGNSVLVVEHDEDMIRAADHCIDMGPGAGVHGGRVTAQGTPAQIEANPPRSPGATCHAACASKSPANAKRLCANTPPTPSVAAADKTRPRVHTGAGRAPGRAANNLQQVSVDIPVGLLTCVTGVSGSGKSTLINDTLYTAAARSIHRAHAGAAPTTTSGPGFVRQGHQCGPVARLAARRAPTPPPTPACSPPSAS